MINFQTLISLFTFLTQSPLDALLLLSIVTFVNVEWIHFLNSLLLLLLLLLNHSGVTI